MSGPDRFRWVDPATFAMRLDLNDQVNGWWLAEGLDVGSTPAIRTYIKQKGVDGATLATSERDITPMAVPLFVAQQVGDIPRKLKELKDFLSYELDREFNCIELRPRGATGSGGAGNMGSGSAVLTQTGTVRFTPYDVGRDVTVAGANLPGGSSVIASWQSTTQVTLTEPAGAGVAGAAIAFTDGGSIYFDTYRADIPSLLKGDDAPSPFRDGHYSRPMILNIDRAPQARGATKYL